MNIKWFKTYFTAGLLVMIPLCVTIWFLQSTVNFFDDLAMRFFPRFQDISDGFPGAGLILTFIIFFLVGIISHTVFGGWLWRLSERILAKMPFVGAVYATSKQIFQAFLVRKGSKSLQKVALLRYPSEQHWCICFVTGDAPQKIKQDLGKDVKWCSVFIPTAPNPTSGILLIVEEEKLHILDMAVEEGMRFVVTAGMALPDQNLIKKGTGVSDKA
ncbi:MAG: DUF502 domain-containing protein [Alphaproteobacteria bacterium]|nr:DUF502 domain-containing protein [Alphaproteobacteria bacterium]